MATGNRKVFLRQSKITHEVCSKKSNRVTVCALGNTDKLMEYVY